MMWARIGALIASSTRLMGARLTLDGPAPMIIGAGPSSVSLAPIERVDEAIRAPMRAHILGDEVLLDCDLSAQRIGIGIAKKST